jgi:protein-S-isoprenylcysteine O-methyltransferase Ste14
MMANEKNELDKPLSPFFIAIIPFYSAFFIGLFLFPVAQDWRWLQAWLLVAAFSLILGVGYYRINKENPRVLRNRMKLKKQGLTAATKISAGSDRFIMPIMSAGFFAALLLPSLGRRFGWPELPFWLTIIGLLISSAGNMIVLMSMYQNAHASKILDINQEQQLINTGLYGKVRHPLYTGAIWMILGLPIALGSFWGLLPALIACLSLVWRIKFEEDMLLKGMAGYAEYREQVKYKLFPGIY